MRSYDALKSFLRDLHALFQSRKRFIAHFFGHLIMKSICYQCIFLKTFFSFLFLEHTEILMPCFELNEKTTVFHCIGYKFFFVTVSSLVCSIGLATQITSCDIVIACICLTAFLIISKNDNMQLVSMKLFVGVAENLPISLYFLSSS